MAWPANASASSQAIGVRHGDTASRVGAGAPVRPRSAGRVDVRRWWRRNTSQAVSPTVASSDQAPSATRQPAASATGAVTIETSIEPAFIADT